MEEVGNQAQQDGDSDSRRDFAAAARRAAHEKSKSDALARAQTEEREVQRSEAERVLAVRAEKKRLQLARPKKPLKARIKNKTVRVARSLKRRSRRLIHRNSV